MNRKIAVAAIGLAFLASGPAHPQWLSPMMGRATDLTAEDFDRMRTTVQRDIHGKRPDTVATWDNPASGNSGTITLLRSFTRNSKPCEEIEYRIVQRTMRPELYVFVSCRQPDGSWKLES